MLVLQKADFEKNDSLESQDWTQEDVLAAVNQLIENLKSTDSKAVQNALKANIERVDLKFRTVQEGKRQIQRCCGGEIHLVTERQVAGARFELTTSRL